jgi:hypothetical protein
MPFTRTITEQDLDAETRKFVQELGDTSHGHDAEPESAAMEVPDGACFDSRFGE